MRRLLILRHAKTEPGALGKDDRSRALIEHGQHDARRIGAYLTSHALIPDLVLLSPARRVQETWQHLSPALKATPAVKTDDRVYEASVADFFSVITAATASAQTVLLIGHNPSLHEGALSLVAAGDLAARERLADSLPTAGLVVIDFVLDDWRGLHPHSGRLDRFITPKLLDAATS